MQYNTHSESIFSGQTNGYIQNKVKMQTLGAVFLKGLLAAAIPFGLLAIGLATWQIWALMASCFSAVAIGMVHLYKLYRMVREDVRAGRKPNPFKYLKKSKKEL